MSAVKLHSSCSNVDNSTVDLHELHNGNSTRSLCNNVNKSLDGTSTCSACNSNDQAQVDAVTDNLYVQLQDGKVPDLGNKGIKFAHLNVHSLIGKIDEFRHLCGSTFDLISVNETLCDNIISDNELKLDGYSILRHDRTRDGGGVAVYINDNFHFK